MPIAPSSFMVERTGTCAVLDVRHRTVIVAIEAELLDSWASAADGEPTPYALWALTIPMRVACFADGFYTATAPVPLACANCVPGAPRCRIVVSLHRWDLCKGTRSALLLAPLDAPSVLVREALEEALGVRRAEAQLPPPLKIAPVVRWRLSGTEMLSPGLLAEVEWQPLLHRRWYELKSYVRQGTVVPHYSARAGRRTTNGADSYDGSAGSLNGGSPASTGVMFAGDVKEADAVSVNRACIRWTDGVVGLWDEVKPYYRVYQPARPEKTIRVRRFPHRYADVVGEVPFGQRIEAFGRATDPFTAEQYALVYLPAEEAFATHISTYHLTYVEEGRYIWGWSKLSGASGLPLLVEAEDNDAKAGHIPAGSGNGCAIASPARDTRSRVQEGDGSDVMPLPEPTFYTPVRDGRPVSIRSMPCMSSSVVREMEMNEVRAAVALVTVPLRLPADPASAPVSHVFLEWQGGGYSLLRNATESFLAPVQLSRVPRRFPIRTRSGGDDGTVAAPEVLDLCRARSHAHRHSSAASEDKDEEAKLAEMMRPHRTPARVAVDTSLLSPHSLPACLQEALRRGVVRLEDLPAVGGDGEANQSDSSGDCSSAC
ncbi:hypothetical protein - conserved [Leishmania donovani]|uniref:Hypothetical_protein_conserved n=1 Tax=Leishmania donovani TaxID=5661 RepID=A0A504XCS8_LEIDO|nr:hypothetical protein CGC20_33140 [Leishmania donovani]CAJ1989911.1 hypothetical protein - conserved [Leishmania donovani]VDZ45773.1 hypothetical_protein_conserved [Leishmania donovani]